MTRIETYRVFGLCVALASGASLLQGCSDSGSGNPPATGAGGSGTGAGGSGGGMTGQAVTYCSPAYPAPLPVTLAAISDFDGEAGALVQSITPGGVWAVDVDLSPMGTSKADSMLLEACGTTGMGLHFKGMNHVVWGADVAAAIVSQTIPVDVSKYSGVSFVMKSMTATSFLFKVQNPYSQPPCGKCDDMLLGAECYSGFTKDISVPAGSTAPITVKWSELSQQTWGYHAPGVAAFDSGNLISMAFAWLQNVPFDVCIDDVKFIP
jgi:hypothetical protein